VQDDEPVGRGLEELGDRAEMFATLGEDEWVAAVDEFAQRVGCDLARAGVVGSDGAEDLLDAWVDRESRWIESAVLG